MAYDNTNKGAIWGNKDKQTDTQPDFKGSINIEGVEYWLSGWKRDPNGNPQAPSVKFSVKRKEEVHAEGMAQANQAMPQQYAVGAGNQPQQQAPQQQAPQQAPDDFNDEIPW